MHANLNHNPFLDYPLNERTNEEYNPASSRTLEKIMHKKIVQSEITSHVDRDTGEVVTETNTKVVRFPQEPPFVKMYIQDLCAIVGVADADQSLWWKYQPDCVFCGDGAFCLAP